jgi:RNA polymerase sigma factor (sigma-70 family)
MGGMDATVLLPLLRRAQQGDAEAANQLFAAVGTFLEAQVRRYGRPTDPAESTADLVNHARLRAWQNLGTFRGEGTDDEALARFRDWLATVVRRVVANHRRDAGRLRRRRPRPHQPIGNGDSTDGAGFVDPPASEPTPSANVREDETLQRIRDRLQSLPEDVDREIMRLFCYEGQPLRQIAARLGLTYDQVRYRFAKAKEWLDDIPGSRP